MLKQRQYERTKPLLLNDKNICKENQRLFRKYLSNKEEKLVEMKELPKLTETQYKTLCQQISALRNINLWFKNEPLRSITKKDIKRVYDLLRGDEAVTAYGSKVRDKRSYYEKYFKSDLFELAGKKTIAQKVIKYYNTGTDEEVRFFKEETFNKINSVIKNPTHLSLTHLAWDVGENIFTLLELQKKDCVKQKNEITKESEYLINLPKEKLKATRTPRSEITNFKETVEYLDIILAPLNPEDKLFNFGHRQALKFLKRAVKLVDAKCTPKGQAVTWKDYRSSMSCYLLKSGWSTDECKARLGHKPSSSAIDKYATYLAIGRHKPKQKIHDNNLEQLRYELEEAKKREKLHSQRMETIGNNVKELEVFKKGFQDILSASDDEGFEIIINPRVKLNKEKLKKHTKEIIQKYG